MSSCSSPGGRSEPLSQHSVEVVARAAGLAAPAVFVEEVGSTNDELAAMASSGAPEWTVVAAGHQTAGRGRLGRSWVAPPGSALLVSVLLRPGRPAAGPLIGLAAAVSLAVALDEACGVPTRCKWPNDVVAGERKIAGILPEGRVRGGDVHVIVGAGINLTQRPEEFPVELEATATSVVSQGGRADAGRLLGAYLEGLRRRYDRTAGISPAALGEYRSLCATLGASVAATDLNGTPVRGEAIAVGDAGQLLVRAPGGEVREVGFGDVRSLR